MQKTFFPFLCLISLSLFIMTACAKAIPIAPPISPSQTPVLPTGTSAPQPTETVIPTSTLGVSSTLIGKDGMTLLYVPAGAFTMGAGEFSMGNDSDDDEKPVHTVDLNAFWIDQTEVTVRMYSLCVEAGVCKEPTSKKSYTRSNYYGNAEYNNYPVIYVNWNMSKAYCEWMDRRLPTEAEWEKAARGENAFAYPWGNDAPNNSLLNFDSAVGDTTEVGKYPEGESIYGALDMAGNVWEWVEDWYDAGYYSISPSSNPLGPNSGQYHALRGGSWYNNGGVGSSVRVGYTPDVTNDLIGFRCAMSATP